ncbi:MAG: SUMF1/EgtB/PvdO family nonheme iron enzyme [Acidobacteriota bacterium]|nr:SUMF1/EgtB/PvdO family nonheme iron enzyme [Acidobacteriota bacterium]
MKTALLLLVFFALMIQAALPQQANSPLSKDQVLDLVKFGMDSAELAQRIKDHGISFEPTDDDLESLGKAGAQEPVIQALRQAKPKPLTREQVGKLVAGGVPSERAAALVKQHGIDFVADDHYLNTLRVAGADDTLIAALREASGAAVATLVVATSADAEVYLDGELKGRASPQGTLTLKANPGVHTLKVSLKGKKDYAQQVTLPAGQTAKIHATLVDLPGSLRVQAPAGAEVFVDKARQGKADATGQLVLSEVTPGPHEVRVTAPGKKEFRQSVTVQAGEGSSVEARFESLGPTPGQVQENPKDGLNYVWIAPGTFIMGCSPGDDKCHEEEKPSHKVTITKGFWMGQSLVTVGAYKRFAAAKGRKVPGHNTSNENAPVRLVSWFDADTYCGWLAGRLPTEAEWEYAARGGSAEKLYGPADEVVSPEVGWHGRPHAPAANRLPNGFGLYDMLGEMWEWVYDRFDKHYYSVSPPQDPPGPEIGKYRVLRGGTHWSAKNTRVSDRSYEPPAGGVGTEGFRCVTETANP